MPQGIIGTSSQFTFWRGTGTLVVASALGIIAYSVGSHMMLAIVDLFRQGTGNTEGATNGG